MCMKVYLDHSNITQNMHGASRNYRYVWDESVPAAATSCGLCRLAPPTAAEGREGCGVGGPTAGEGNPAALRRRRTGIRVGWRATCGNGCSGVGKSDVRFSILINMVVCIDEE